MMVRSILAGLSILIVSPVMAQSSSGDIRTQGQFVSETTAAPPLTVQSSDTVSDLSADKLDGFDVGDFATPGSGVGVHYENVVGLPGGEITQECAVNTGCFETGDDPGFPVTITQPGSYRLTSNLNISDANTTAISVDARAVTVDLKGFTISGPTTCTVNPVSCSPTGDGDGIFSNQLHTTVRSGQISGMGQDGIDIRYAADVRSIRALSNGGDGISVARDARVAGSNAHGNGGNGISASEDATITDSVSSDNGGHGYSLISSRAVGNVAAANDGEGIHCVTECLVKDNRADANAQSGIRLQGGGTAIGNVTVSNGGDGLINTFGSAIVRDNRASDNGEYGLNLDPNSGYEDNVSSGNSNGAVSGGIELGANICDGDTTCP